jgi:hypothetical protein
MGFNNISWNLMRFNGISWDFMRFYEIAWDSLSQEPKLMVIIGI